MKYYVFEFVISLCRCVPQAGRAGGTHDPQHPRDSVMEAASELETSWAKALLPLLPGQGVPAPPLANLSQDIKAST